MKEVEIKLFELTKEEACNLGHEQVLIVNPIVEVSFLEWSDDKDFIGRMKHANKILKYYTFKEPKFTCDIASKK